MLPNNPKPHSKPASTRHRLNAIAPPALPQPLYGAASARPGASPVRFRASQSL